MVATASHLDYRADHASAPAASSAPATLRKDLLRVGTWHAPAGTFHATTKLLDTLVTQFALARARGIKIPVVWNHSHDSRDRLGTVLELFREGQTLWGVLSVPEAATARKLSLDSHEVSVEVQDNWRDGMGNLYPSMLTHVGVVTLPVVPGQQRFTHLSLRRGDTTMTHDSSAAPTKITRLATEGGDGSGYPTVDDTAATWIVERVNQLLSAPSMSMHLPEDTTGANLCERLDFIAQQITTPEPEPSEAPMSGETVTDMSKAAGTGELQQLRLQVSELTRQLSLERSASEAAQKAAFVGKLDGAIKRGKLLPAHRAGLLEAGATAKYALSLLAHLDDLPDHGVFPGGTGASAKSASADAPVPAGATGPMTAERAKEIVKGGFRGW